MIERMIEELLGEIRGIEKEAATLQYSADRLQDLANSLRKLMEDFAKANSIDPYEVKEF